MVIKQTEIKPNIKALFYLSPHLELANKAINTFWLPDPADNLDHPGHKLTLIKEKQGNRRIYRFENQGEVYYIKVFQPLLKESVKILEPRGLKCFWISLELMEAGFTVAEPVLALTYRKSPFITESIFIAKEYKGITLTELMKMDYPNQLKERILADFNTVLGSFYYQGFYQSDPNSSNYLVKLTGDTWEIAIIDLESVFHQTCFSYRLIAKSVTRIYKKIYQFLEELNLYSQSKFESYLDAFFTKYRSQSKNFTNGLILGLLQKKIQTMIKNTANLH